MRGLVTGFVVRLQFHAEGASTDVTVEGEEAEVAAVAVVDAAGVRFDSFRGYRDDVGDLRVLGYVCGDKLILQNLVHKN